MALTLESLSLLVLGLSKTPASKEEVNQAYRKMSLIVHPDTGGNSELFRALTEAKEFTMSRVVVPTPPPPPRFYTPPPRYTPPPPRPEPKKAFGEDIEW